jgi:hypothetical protein
MKAVKAVIALLFIVLECHGHGSGDPEVNDSPNIKPAYSDTSN